jgi:hypothetical protein
VIAKSAKPSAFVVPVAVVEPVPKNPVPETRVATIGAPETGLPKRSTTLAVTTGPLTEAVTVRASAAVNCPNVICAVAVFPAAVAVTV